MERVQLQLPLLTQNDVVVRHHQQRAYKLLLDLLDVLVMHVMGVVVGHLVNENLVWELHGKSVAVDSDLLHVVLAPDTDFLLGYEVLYDDVRHHVPVGVPILVQAMHGRENDLVHHDGPVVAAHDHIVVSRADGDGPNPILTLPKVSQRDAFPAPELHRLAATAKHEVVAAGEEVYGTGIEVQSVLATVFLTRHLVERKRLVPTADHQHVRWFSLRRHWVPYERPNWRRTDDVRLLGTKLVANAHVPAEQAEGQVEPVICPRHGQDLGTNLVLGDRLLLG
mmetsp:Transcript_8857/g.22931  ORF Transcript_8857/g.22931 Transcript_8857/m.22931 type:complete len:280 (-) Transcript_8857:581-1420(-)